MSDPNFSPDIFQQARSELEQERRRKAIDCAKDRLRSAKWWHRFFPFAVTIHIKRRSEHE